VSIVERDPWRLQYFAHVPCPTAVFVPTEDPDSYHLYPGHRWVYNKLRICESQGLVCAPHGVAPPRYPVFSKPIFNLRGMGAGSLVIHNESEYRQAYAPGHMWMQVLEGDHVSTDVAVIGGRAAWWRHVVGKSIGNGMFDYWTVLAEARPEIERYCGEWIAKELSTYTGMLNFETIGGRIIEVHLRFSDQWPDLYGGDRWVESVVALYAESRWPFDDRDRRTGYSVILFGAHGLKYEPPDQDMIDEIRSGPAVSSVQVTFHPDRAPEDHSMPVGGFRLAIVNCWNLEAGFKARERLALALWSTQKIARRRRRRSVAPPIHWRQRD
jgi:hypothetical protein